MPKLDTRRIRIMNRSWQLVFVHPGDFEGQTQYGECDEPTAKNKKIKINQHIDGELLLDTLIHEMTHAAFPIIDEDCVEQFATDVARVLAELGYGRSERNDETQELIKQSHRNPTAEEGEVVQSDAGKSSERITGITHGISIKRD